MEEVVEMVVENLLVVTVQMEVLVEVLMVVIEKKMMEVVVVVMGVVKNLCEFLSFRTFYQVLHPSV